VKITRAFSDSTVLGFSVGVATMVTLMGILCSDDDGGNPPLPPREAERLIDRFDREAEDLAVSRGYPLERIRAVRREAYLAAFTMLAERRAELGLPALLPRSSPEGT